MTKPFKKHELLKSLKKYSVSSCAASNPQPEAKEEILTSGVESKKNLVRISSEIRELIPAFLKLTWEEISSLDNAVSEENYELIRRLGHRICRSLSVLRIRRHGSHQP
ncbi:MAG: hypothetical protein HC887_06030, partial [Desulfobacteraceae bacterium]|nr:hypothetical protein [Desulfobacteraceae bacterium]